jgi:hypothetical protein
MTSSPSNDQLLYVKPFSIKNFSLISNKSALYQAGKGFIAPLVNGGCFICVMVVSGD